MDLLHKMVKCLKVFVLTKEFNFVQSVKVILCLSFILILGKCNPVNCIYGYVSLWGRMTLDDS
jgi:hypothetical protein